MDPTLFAPGDIQDANLQSYLSGNPIMLSDPSGHDGTATEQAGNTGLQGLLFTMLVTGLRVGFAAAPYVTAALSVYNLYLLGTDPQFREDFIAANPENPGDILAADFAASARLAARGETPFIHWNP